MANFSRISKLLSLILRHRPDEFALAIDAYGYVPMDEVLGAIQQRYSEVTEEDIRNLVETSDQRRFKIDEKGICALYGHTFFVEMDGEPIEPPEFLYLGCVPRVGQKMRAEGIKPGDRFYVHLSLSSAIAEARNRRLEQACIVEVEALKAHRAGILFYQRGPVVLTREIPAEFVGSIRGLEQSGSSKAKTGPARTTTPSSAPIVEQSQEKAASGQVQYGRRPRKVVGRR